MQAARVLRQLGGVAESATLIKILSRPVFRRAVRTGEILRAGPDRYVLPGGKERLEAAARAGGSLTLLSAAQHHGWMVQRPPTKPQVVVPRRRVLSAERSQGIELFRGEVSGIALGKIDTVIECARRLPFVDALAVADSALKDRELEREGLMAAALASPRTGRSRAVRVIEHADARAENTFESAVRGLAIEAGLEVEPQVKLGDVGHCDIVDRSRRIAIECDSWRFHGGNESAWESDVRRYTAFARLRYVVVRFTVTDSDDRPDYVRDVLRDLRELYPPGWLAATS
jgi:hypothetical protein